MKRTHTFRGAASRGAFTLIELMVVVAIMLILIIVTVPAVGRIIESANYSAAVNAVRGTLGNARTKAMQTGKPAGVVFLFDIEKRTYTLLTVQQHATAVTLSKERLSSTNAATMTSGQWALRPMDNITPVQLPKGTAVFGLSFNIADEDAPMIDTDTFAWYAGNMFSVGGSADLTPWLFPRNDPRVFLRQGQDPWRDDDGSLDVQEDAVRHANSFCIVFNENGSIVDSASIGASPNNQDLYLEFTDLPYDLDDPDKEVYDDPIRFDPEASPSPAPVNPTTNPEVLLRTVSQLAVIDLTRLADGTGVELPWLLRPDSSQALKNAPNTRFLTNAELGDTPNNTIQRMNDWITRNAEVLAFNRYTGETTRRQ